MRSLRVFNNSNLGVLEWRQAITLNEFAKLKWGIKYRIEILIFEYKIISVFT